MRFPLRQQFCGCQTILFERAPVRDRAPVKRIDVFRNHARGGKARQQRAHSPLGFFDPPL